MSLFFFFSLFLDEVSQILASKIRTPERSRAAIGLSDILYRTCELTIANVQSENLKVLRMTTHMASHVNADYTSAHPLNKPSSGGNSFVNEPC